MKVLGYYSGAYDGIRKMAIPMNNRIYWFGDGVHDAGPCCNYNISALDGHVDRFFDSAGLLQIQMPCTKEELKTLLKDLVREMDTGDLFVYYQVTRGTAVHTHEFPADALANLWIMLGPLPSPELAKKIKLITVEDIRFFHYNIKTLDLIPSVMATQRASGTGCKETVLHRGDRMTECVHSNCHTLEEGILCTTPVGNLILPSIAGAHLINNRKELGIPVSETPYALGELMYADEVLVTSSAKFCSSASGVGKRLVGGKAPELFKRVQDAVQAGFIEQTDPHLD